MLLQRLVDQHAGSALSLMNILVLPSLRIFGHFVPLYHCADPGHLLLARYDRLEQRPQLVCVLQLGVGAPSIGLEMVRFLQPSSWPSREMSR